MLHPPNSLGHPVPAQTEQLLTKGAEMRNYTAEAQQKTALPSMGTT